MSVKPANQQDGPENPKKKSRLQNEDRSENERKTCRARMRCKIARRCRALMSFLQETQYTSKMCWGVTFMEKYSIISRFLVGLIVIFVLFVYYPFAYRLVTSQVDAGTIVSATNNPHGIAFADGRGPAATMGSNEYLKIVVDLITFAFGLLLIPGAFCLISWKAGGNLQRYMRHSKKEASKYSKTKRQQDPVQPDKSLSIAGKPDQQPSSTLTNSSKTSHQLRMLLKGEKDEATMHLARIICGRSGNKRDVMRTYCQLRLTDLLINNKMAATRKEVVAELQQEIRLKFSKRSSAREWLLSAYNLYKTGNYGEALEACNCAIALAPTAVAYFVRGALHHKSGQEDIAMDDLRKAANLGHKKAKNILAARGVVLN